MSVSENTSVGTKSYSVAPKEPSKDSEAPSNDKISPNTTKTTTLLNLPGTRTSIQNNQLLTPIGIPSIDYFLGKIDLKIILTLKRKFSKKYLGYLT